MVKNPPAHAGDMGLIPDPERPHIATKPVCHIYELVLQNLGATATEVCVPQGLCSTARATTATRSLCTVKEGNPNLHHGKEKPVYSD